MNDLHQFLARHPRVAIDTNIFVYLMNAHGRYGKVAESVFSWIQQPGHSAVTSVITVTELLVPLYRSPRSAASNPDFHDLTFKPNGSEKASEFLAVLRDTYPNLEWIDANFAVADLAAQYRARYGLKTPDALHAATAAHAGATGFVTNDVSFSRVEEFETLQLEALL